MEGGIVVFNSGERLFHPDFRGQFFLDLPFEGLCRCFPWLDLTTREFPAILEFSIAPLGGEDFTLVDDQGSHNLHRFQSHLPFLRSLLYLILYHSRCANFRTAKAGLILPCLNFIHGWKTFPTPGTHPGVLPAGIDFRPYLIIPNVVLLLRISVPIFSGNLYVYYPKWMHSNTFKYSITYYHCWKMILKIKNALAGTPTTAISLYTSLQMSKLFYI